ncbi:aldo/keto reductase, partial [Jatrophihabitans endophyticus]|uniref:aldo/keto reductase n=1 Tax=Jatrophihabitans endophyticus TaxID=1206085 RepID=UPI001A03643E
TATQLRAALSIADVAAVTVHYNVGVRLGAAVRRVAEEKGIVFSPWHPGTVPPDSRFREVIDPIAAEHGATAAQIALAWQLHRTATALPIPGTTSHEHLHQNLGAVDIALADDEVKAITALTPGD